MILLAYPVLAAEWKQIEEKSYIDIASIQEYNDPSSYDKKRYNRNEKEFWIKSLNDKSSYFTDYEKTYNKKVWYIILKYIVDCNNKTIATKSGAIYDTNGNLIDSYDVEHILLNRNDIIPIKLISSPKTMAIPKMPPQVLKPKRMALAKASKKLILSSSI